jgi:hypothetical protein
MGLRQLFANATKSQPATRFSGKPVLFLRSYRFAPHDFSPIVPRERKGANHLFTALSF